MAIKWRTKDHDDGWGTNCDAQVNDNHATFLNKG